MGTWYFQYKCRNCGKIETPTGTSHEPIMVNGLMAALTNTRNVVDGVPVRLFNVHVCEEKKQYGIADLIGCVYEEQE